jgi:DNA-binding transcriptional MerR regulator
MSDAAGDADADHPGGRSRLKKAPNAFRTISEVADDLHIPQHVLRFWETKFTQVRPLKRGGGRRYYRPDDIALLRRISELLYIQGYTIKGVQRLLREGGGRLSDNIGPPSAEDQADDDPEADSQTGSVPLLPGFAPPEPSLRPPSRGRPEQEVERLRAILTEILHELEALRSLLP